MVMFLTYKRNTFDRIAPDIQTFTKIVNISNIQVNVSQELNYQRTCCMAINILQTYREIISYKTKHTHTSYNISNKYTVLLSLS